MSAERQQFHDLIGITLRLYRANARPLTVVAAVATLVTIVATFARSGPSLRSFNSASFGLTLERGAGSFHMALDAQVLAYGLVGLLAGAWASATMVPLLLRFVRKRLPVRYEIGIGLPYLGSVVLVTLLVTLVVVALRVILAFALPETLGLFPLEPIVQLLVGTAVLFYVPLIIDGQRGITSLLASWRLVLASGFWRLFALLLAAELVSMLAATGVGIVGGLLPLAAEALAVQLVVGVFVMPLMVTFTTVLYLLCVGERAPLVVATQPTADQQSRGSLA